MDPAMNAPKGFATKVKKRPFHVPTAQDVTLHANACNADIEFPSFIATT